MRWIAAILFWVFIGALHVLLLFGKKNAWKITNQQNISQFIKALSKSLFKCSVSKITNGKLTNIHCKILNRATSIPYCLSVTLTRRIKHMTGRGELSLNFIGVLFWALTIREVGAFTIQSYDATY